jgi:protein-S-isoprenylcysteine O-methyltransferase Ste14
VAAVSPTVLAKTSYGLLFVVVLPALLVAWAQATESHVAAPAIHSTFLGIALCAIGVGFLLSGWTALWRFGGGLPMNIAPPPRFVSKGIYAVVPHPIYTGFCLLCLGVALAEGSASGLWLVTPCVILGCFSLVLGYERCDLSRRFGPAPSNSSSGLPCDSPEPATLRNRLTCYLFVLIPWLVLYRASVALGVPANAISTYLPFEHRLPVLEWSEVVYASAYLWVCLAPLLAVPQKSLRKFVLAGLLSMAVVFPLFLILPFVAAPRPFTPHTIAGRLLAWERSLDSPVVAFPSFHVIWAMLALPVYEDRRPRWRWIWRSWTAVIAISCLTTGMHSLLDVFAGVLVGRICLRPKELWQTLRRSSESLANSWREWRIGPVRIINHAIYAAIAAFIVLSAAGILAGPNSEAFLFAVAFAALILSGLWAQLVEGSPGLLRPFGYFGGFAGIGLGALVAEAFGARFWLLLAAFAVGAPWMQAIGRLRCLVQGCCHGRPASAEIGICYDHERSRVSHLPGLRGIPIHPTPLYSILWNVYLGVLMAHFWIVHVPLHFICGIYCILMGIGRFAEEAYRGEPQTPAIGGLRLYQWIALIAMLGGALITALGESSPAPDPHPSNQIWLPALAFGLLAGFALGVDFPASHRRFARLA